MLKKIKIEGLFNKFNYDIELKEEGITILTGPNGYGKTTILKIIYAAAIKNLIFFFQLPFKKIVLTGENSEIILLNIDNTFEIQWGNKKIIRYNKNNLIKKFKELSQHQAYLELDENTWVDKRNDTLYTIDDLINESVENESEIKDKFPKYMTDFVDVYFIREHRLIKGGTSSKEGDSFYVVEGDAHQINSFGNMIEEYAKELSIKINQIFAKSSKIGQELDSTFPRRLFDETRQMSAGEFKERYDIIKEKQKSLSLYGLSAIKEDSHPSFKEENAKALLVYLDDTEKKLAVFDDILKKLQIFSTILNERQFAFKQLEISPDFGFKFKAEDGKELSLTDLSSGEQQEVVLLYELLFRVTPDTLVLIDEPEISLHVAWQKEVINDLLKIIGLQKITVITATHSPQIIGEHWDLVVDLWDLSSAETSR